MAPVFLSLMKNTYPKLGCGIGLRTQHFPDLLEHWPKMDWFEAVTENFMDTEGRPLHILEQVRKRYPVALHGVSLSIGSCDALNLNYLDKLKALVTRIDPVIVSDHLCWSGVDGYNLHDLLPLPFTEEAIKHIARRIESVQDFLGRQILLENVSTYVTYKHSVIPEWEFLVEVATRSGCGILLDLNNIYVNSKNHQFDPYEYIEAIPGNLVGQFHIAGHTDMGTFLFDTHSAPVIDPVWELYRFALTRWGQISTLIEWDEDIPSFERLSEECARARKIYQEFEHTPVSLQANPKKERPVLKQPLSLSLLKIQRGIKSHIQTNADEIPKNLPLNPQGGVTGAERIKVYAEGYPIRIEEALKEVYESVRHVIGANSFHQLAHAYALHHPSKDYNLTLTGRHLPRFLETYPVTQELAFLPDLAKLEWAIAEAFHSPLKPALNPAQLAGLSEIDWDEIQISFQPSLHLMASHWPVLDIWKARKLAIEEVKIDLMNRPQILMVFRHDLKVQCELIVEAQYRLLQGLISGLSLGKVCEMLAEWSPEGELPLAEWFSVWNSYGLITNLENLKKGFSLTP
jgi:uncharacterized protein (UPF0276 family)